MSFLFSSRVYSLMLTLCISVLVLHCVSPNKTNHSEPNAVPTISAVPQEATSSAPVSVSASVQPVVSTSTEVKKPSVKPKRFFPASKAAPVFIPDDKNSPAQE